MCLWGAGLSALHPGPAGALPGGGPVTGRAPGSRGARPPWGPTSPPAPAPEPPLRPSLPGARGGARGQAGVTHRDLGRDPAPGQAVSGCSRALPHSARQSRGGAGRWAPRDPPPPSPHPRQPRGSRRPHPSARRGGLGRGGPGSRAGAGGAVGGGAAGGGARPGAPRAPAAPANGRPAFGKIAIYGHVLGPRAPPPHARAPRGLNSGGGGRTRSQSLQPPAFRSAPLALALCAPPPPR